MNPHEAKRIFGLCKECASLLYEAKPPSEQYQKRVVMLLYGTAAHESGGFRWRRQRKFSLWSKSPEPRGAFGYWQTEWRAVVDNMEYLDDHPAMARRLAAWLGESFEPDWYRQIPLPTIMMMIMVNDKIACAMARVHYYRFPEAIPVTVHDQSEYWDKYYNTTAAPATGHDYRKSWSRYAPEIINQ